MWVNRLYETPFLRNSNTCYRAIAFLVSISDRAFQQKNKILLEKQVFIFNLQQHLDNKAWISR